MYITNKFDQITVMLVKDKKSVSMKLIIQMFFHLVNNGNGEMKII